MTTGELLNASSSVSGVSALTHLQNLVGGGGVDHFFPYTEIKVTFEEQNLRVDFTDQDLEVEFSEQDLIADLESPVLNVTFDEEINDINITC